MDIVIKNKSGLIIPYFIVCHSKNRINLFSCARGPNDKIKRKCLSIDYHFKNMEREAHRRCENFGISFVTYFCVAALGCIDATFRDCCIAE